MTLYGSAQFLPAIQEFLNCLRLAFSPRLSSVDQGARERVLLALKILTSRYDQNAENSATQEEVDELKMYLGFEAADYSLDQIACMVIQREIKREEENRS